MLKKLIKKFRKKSKPLFANTVFENPAPTQATASYITWNNSIERVDNSTSAIMNNATIAFNADAPKLEEKKERIVKKPVEVYQEILTEEPKIELGDIDKRIAVVNKRFTMLKELGLHPADEGIALKYLQARKKLAKEKKYTIPWKVTTDQLVKDLCSKYKLMSVSFTGYFKNVPNEALDQLDEYRKMWKKFRGDDVPNVGLICDEGGPEHKKDPILYAESPFGRWFYVLGAWDKEVEYVDEIVYNGK